MGSLLGERMGLPHGVRGCEYLGRLPNRSSCRARAVLALAVLLSAASAALGAPAPPPPVSPAPLAGDACPVRYERHRLQDIASGSKRPYLLGGIYDKADCVNCHRGGLAASFCSFRPAGKAPFWDHQLCESGTVAAFLARTLSSKDAKEVLTMTPCDLWPLMRGRTLWIVG
jgi:hypothetical protein